MMQYLYHGLDTPVSYAPEDRSQAHADYNLSQLKRNLDAIEARLGNGDYLLGAFSLVDVAAGSVLAMGTKFGLGIEDYSRTATWLNGCMERRAFKQAR
jgi:glutathione S-transferase